jgi:hypothetical protein
MLACEPGSLTSFASYFLGANFAASLELQWQVAHDAAALPWYRHLILQFVVSSILAPWTSLHYKCLCAHTECKHKQANKQVYI